ncbi:MAG: hypothetical protein AABY22_14710, partial [Nanoarchaeota archaeon]
LLQNHHKVEPVMPINQYKSRFAYRIYVNGRPIAGLWTLDSVNVSKGTATYKKYTKKQSKK